MEAVYIVPRSQKRIRAHWGSGDGRLG